MSASSGKVYPSNSEQPGAKTAPIRFAAHLGFPGPDRPLFDALETRDPLKQIALLARLDFAGVFDPFTMQRAPADQAMIGAAARDAGLEMGSFLYAPIAQIRQSAVWTDAAIPISHLRSQIEAAVAAAGRLGSRDLVVLGIRSPNVSDDIQHQTMAERLGLMAEIAADAGLTLNIEPVSRHRLPEMVLHRIDDAARLVRAANHSMVRLAFDTGHVHANGDDVVASLTRYWSLIGTFQLADFPDRVEPGAGHIDFAAVFALLREKGMSALCELEHIWLDPSPDCQRAYPHRLRALAAGVH